MSDLVYGKDEKPREDSPLDLKKARIDATIRVLLTVAVIGILAGVTALSIAAFVETQQSKQIAEQVLENQEAIKDVADSNQRLNRKIVALAADLEDCNTPDGECYQRRVAELAAQTGLTNAVSQIAVWCADRDGVQTLSDIRHCVRDALGRGG